MEDRAEKTEKKMNFLEEWNVYLKYSQEVAIISNVLCKFQHLYTGEKL